MVKYLSDYQIDAAHIRRDALRELLQHLIARIVPVRVVDRLEIIDVEDEERDRLALALALLEHGREMARHVAPIIEPGQLIGDRHFQA